ncbi:MAG: hypothetical protein ACRDZ5_02975 [Acidimicrobiales bacterium]
MLEIYAVVLFFDTLAARLQELRRDPDRGDVAEKIVIVGIFVILAIAAGAIITNAVTHEAHNIANNIVTGTVTSNT